MIIPNDDREEFRAILVEIGDFHMPFGRFGPKDFPPRGLPIMDLPEEYLAWFQQRGFPNGRLGELLEMVWSIKDVGMDGVFDPMRKARGGRRSMRKPRGSQSRGNNR
ncbi:MAG: DUF3820 family protein [Akkermansiaceae bacterium]|nr:DUF3820 family protein [Akkermansiaceae bacterium]